VPFGFAAVERDEAALLQRRQQPVHGEVDKPVRRSESR
jgi:hypothetical protein